METSRLFVPLLMELDGLGGEFCYKHVASCGAPDVAGSFVTQPDRF